MVSESLVHVRFSSGSRRKWLSSGFSMREKGKMKVPGESFFSVHGNAWAPMSVKTDNWVVSAVDVTTSRDRNVSAGGLVICCEFKYGVAMPEG